MRVSLLHSVLPRDGVAVLRVMQEGHVDSDERRSVSGEDLTSDYRHQAGTERANTRKKALSKEETLIAVNTHNKHGSSCQQQH